jgi:hypothetical protein
MRIPVLTEAGWGVAVLRTPFFTGRLFQHPQGFVKTLEKLLQILGKEDHRLPFETAFFPVFAFNNVQVNVPQPVFLHIEKIRPVLQYYLRRK